MIVEDDELDAIDAARRIVQAYAPPLRDLALELASRTRLTVDEAEGGLRHALVTWMVGQMMRGPR